MYKIRNTQTLRKKNQEAKEKSYHVGNDQRENSHRINVGIFCLDSNCRITDL